MKYKIFSIILTIIFISIIWHPVIGKLESSFFNTNQDGYTKNKNLMSYNEDDWWPMFRHDSNNLAYSTSTAPNSFTIIWDKGVGYMNEDSPVMYNNRVIMVGKDPKTVYCYNADTGSKHWTYKVGSIMTTSSTPAIFDDRVYIGLKGEELEDKLLCLNLETGRKVWSITEIGNIFSSITIYNNRLYFGADDKNIYCYDIESQEEIWTYETGDNVISSAAVTDGKVYVGSDDFNLYCLDSETGNMTWFFHTKGKVTSSPAVYDGKVYFGSCDDNIYCLDAETGELIWKFKTNYCVESSPSIMDDRIFIGSSDSYLYCLDLETGDLIWKYDTGDFVLASPASADNKVYVNSIRNDLYCINSTNGKLIWKYNPDPDNQQVYCRSSPIIGANRIIAPFYPGSLICFKERPPEIPETPSGPTSGKSGTKYTYTTSTTEPDGNRIYYMFDWGDESNKSWLGPFNSGQKISASHTWEFEGTYNIRAKAKDIYGAESDWSDPLSVNIPKNRIINDFYLDFLNNNSFLNKIFNHLFNFYLIPSDNNR